MKQFAIPTGCPFFIVSGISAQKTLSLKDATLGQGQLP